MSTAQHSTPFITKAPHELQVTTLSSCYTNTPATTDRETYKLMLELKTDTHSQNIRSAPVCRDDRSFRRTNAHPAPLNQCDVTAGAAAKWTSINKRIWRAAAALYALINEITFTFWTEQQQLKTGAMSSRIVQKVVKLFEKDSLK